VQVAIWVLLLGGTSIFLQQAAASKAHRVGFAVDGVAMLQTDLRFASYSKDRAKTIGRGLDARPELYQYTHTLGLRRAGVLLPWTSPST